MNKIRVLHIAKDDKFFDSTFSYFEGDGRLINFAVLVVDSPQYSFKYIERTDVVKLLCDECAIKNELSGSYDVIYFHSLQSCHYRLFKYIPKERLVIWWCWGFELYLSDRGMAPLIPLRLYKPLTQKYINSRERSFPKKIKEYVKKRVTGRIWAIRRNKVIKRVDFFQPVLPIEYSLMKGYKGFGAQEFYPIRSVAFSKVELSQCDGRSKILVGNSASYENNHLDVWHSICDFVPSTTEVIFPISYGKDDYAEFLSKTIKSSSKNIRFLRSFMPKDKYFELLDSCSYAIFGVVRQQSIGNIYYCLRHGMKVFLYKDSLVYKALSNIGCTVFAIEDINMDSFSQPLTDNQKINNIDALKLDSKYRIAVYERFWEDIGKRLLE